MLDPALVPRHPRAAGKHTRVVVTGEGCQHGVQDGIVQVALVTPAEVVDDKVAGPEIDEGVSRADEALGILAIMDLAIDPAAVAESAAQKPGLA